MTAGARGISRHGWQPSWRPSRSGQGRGSRTTIAGGSRAGCSNASSSGRRKHSKLPALIDLVLARPLVSAGMIAAELGVTARAAQDLVAELGLREITGRGRYRAWGIL